MSMKNLAFLMLMLAACGGKSEDSATDDASSQTSNDEDDSQGCESGDLRCDGDVLEECDASAWTELQDCAADGLQCHEDMGGAPPHCM